MSTGDRDGEFGKGHSGPAWEQGTAPATDYPLGTPRPFHLPPKAMDARLRGTVDNMALHLARGQAGRLIEEALSGQTPVEPTEAQAFAKSLVNQVPTDKLSLLPQLTEIARKSAMMRRPNEQALLKENQNWFENYYQGVGKLVALEQQGTQTIGAGAHGHQPSRPLLAEAGNALPVGYEKANEHPTNATTTAAPTTTNSLAGKTDVEMHVTAQDLTPCSTEEETQFKKQVFNTHVMHTKDRGEEFFAGLEPAAQNSVEDDFAMRADASEAAKKLLAAMKADFAQAKKDGDPHALRVIRKIEISSAYRDPPKEFRLWQQTYRAKYIQTAEKRATLPGGQHGSAAVEFLVKQISPYKAAPGYGNHTEGIAFDMLTSEKAAEDFTFEDINKEGKKYQHTVKAGEIFRYRATGAYSKILEKTWIYKWLEQHAVEYGFHRIKTEAWHWEYKP